MHTFFNLGFFILIIVADLTMGHSNFVLNNIAEIGDIDPGLKTPGFYFNLMQKGKL